MGTKRTNSLSPQLMSTWKLGSEKSFLVSSHLDYFLKSYLRRYLLELGSLRGKKSRVSSRQLEERAASWDWRVINPSNLLLIGTDVRETGPDIPPNQTYM